MIKDKLSAYQDLGKPRGQKRPHDSDLYVMPIRWEAGLRSRTSNASNAYRSVNEAASLTSTQRANRVSQDMKILIADDLQLSQRAVLNSIGDICRELKKSDIRTYGGFVKEIRQILGDEWEDKKNAVGNPWLDAAGIMKNSSVWPEVVKIIERKSK